MKSRAKVEEVEREERGKREERKKVRKTSGQGEELKKG